MKTLRVFSIVGLAWYIAWFIIAATSKNIPNLGSLAYIEYFLYAASHAVFTYFQGYKSKSTFLKIISTICCVVLGLFILLSLLTMLTEKDNMDKMQNILIGCIGLTIPFAVALSVITLIYASKNKEKNASRRGAEGENEIADNSEQIAVN